MKSMAPAAQPGLPARLWAWRVLPFVAALWLYKRLLSPLLPRLCRYEPTCSEYMLQAIRQRGVLQGITMGTLRLLRCAPWGGCGYDPVEAFRWPWQRKDGTASQTTEDSESGPPREAPTAHAEAGACGHRH